MQEAGAYVGREDLSSVSADHEELEVASVVGHSDASLGEDAEVQRAVRGVKAVVAAGFACAAARGAERRAAREIVQRVETRRMMLVTPGDSIQKSYKVWMQLQKKGRHFWRP